MALHQSKRTALLNSLNCISSNDLKSLKDLSDGICLKSIISTTFNGPSDDTSLCKNASEVFEDESKDAFVTESGDTLTESIDASVKGSINTSTTDSIDGPISHSKDAPITDSKYTPITDSKDAPITEDAPITDSKDGPITRSKHANTNSKETESVQISMDVSSDINDKVILQRFKFIQNFIDERYNLISMELVSYSACIRADEFELAKVAGFILSEVVRYFANIHNEYLQTLNHLDARVQEDLKECFTLFIFERETLSKDKIENILSNHAKYTAWSPRSSFATPRRNCTSKYRIDLTPTSTTYEDIYSNSPLKSFFDSPIFKKEDIISKEKEILKTRNILHEEELKVEDLQFELNETKQLLVKKDEEIKKLKDVVKGLESEKNPEDREDNQKVQEQYERLKKEHDYKCKEYEREISEYVAKITEQEHLVKLGEKMVQYDEGGGLPLLDLVTKQRRLLEIQRRKAENFENELLEVQEKFEKEKAKFDAVQEELCTEKKKVHDMEIRAAKEQEFYIEKLSELKESTKNDPPSPGIGENLGDVIEEENRMIRLKLKEAELKIKELEMKLERHMVSDKDVPNCDSLSEPKLLVMQEENELIDLQKECDTSNNSEVAVNHSPSMEEVPLIENTPEPGLGALWKNLEDSPSEIKNTNIPAGMEEFRPTSHSTFNDFRLYSICNRPNKNGYSWSFTNSQAESLKMARVHAIQLEEKEEEIKKLKADYEILQLQYKKYSNNIQEKIKAIEDLGKKLSDAKKNEEKQRSMCNHYRDRCMEALDKSKKYDMVCNELKNVEMKRKINENKFRQVFENHKNYRRKKGQEIESLKLQIRELSQTKSTLEKHIDISRSQQEELRNKLKKAEAKLNYLMRVRRKESNSVKEKIVPVTPVTKREEKDASPESFVNSNTLNETANDSSVSGALCRYGLLINSDEADYLCSTSLPTAGMEEDRAKELIRRNSILPFHLQSSYPLEMNLDVSTGKFYVKSEDIKNKTCENSKAELDLNNGICKKRKLADTHSSELESTPVTKMKYKLGTPSSLRNWFKFSRSERKGSIRPKP